MSDRHTCPRRSDPFAYGSGVEGEDTWRPGTSFAGHENDPRFRSCSYCGSIDPDQFMAMVEQGWVVGPTDKNYKAYLGEPVDEPERARRYAHLPEEMRPATVDVGKFYYQHLSDEQKRRFVELINAKRVAIGYPGRFYRLPFFMGRAAPGS